MTTGILVGLIVVLLAAAAYVGVLLVRRTRSVPVAPDAVPAGERPRTVAELVKKRAEPDEALSGPELFVPAVPRADGVAVPAAPDQPAAPAVAGPAAPAQPDTPAGGLEVGDAPWRRAARMAGAEPGGTWATAPLPVVAESSGGADVAPAVRVGAGSVGARSVGAERVDPDRADEGADADRAGAEGLDGKSAEEGVDAGRADADRAGAEGHDGQSAGEGRADGRTSVGSPSVVIVSRAASPWTEPGARPAAPSGREQVAGEPDVALLVPSPWTEPSAPAASPETAAASSTEAPADPAPEPSAEPSADSAPEAPPAVSRPLSDPDLTPLMGIPVIRPVADEPAPVAAPVAEPVAAAAPADEPDDDPSPAPSPRLTDALVSDDDVVLLPPTPTSSVPVVAPAPVGSAQPVWFRVVRRDGEPVAAAVVALLDDHGREVDTTKTATDGGGELRTPHGGRFLMIVSADGHQPRATLLTVDDEPVELALLLPRSAVVTGTVRAGGEVVRDARVVVRQDHSPVDVVDETLTAGDGHYLFDDLAEGTYTVAATAQAGRTAVRVSLAEGADVHLDLDLT